MSVGAGTQLRELKPDYKEDNMGRREIDWLWFHRWWGPIAVITIVLVSQAKGYIAAQEPVAKRLVESPSASPSPASATPQTAAFPDRTYWIDADGLEYFTFVLKQPNTIVDR